LKRSFDLEDVKLLAELRRAGALLTRDGDNLRIKAERTPPAELLEQVRQRKAHLLALLAQPDAPDRPAQAPADWRAALDRLACDALALQRAILAEGERRGFPAVSLGPGRTLGPGRPAWEAFVRSNYPAPHRDGLDLADWLAAHPAQADDDLLG